MGGIPASPRASRWSAGRFFSATIGGFDPKGVYTSRSDRSTRSGTSRQAKCGLHFGPGLLLEGVHALVCDAEEPGGVFGVVWVNGDAEAGGEGEGLAVDEDGPFDGALDGGDEMGEGAVVAEVGGDEGDGIAWVECTGWRGPGLGRIDIFFW